METPEGLPEDVDEFARPPPPRVELNLTSTGEIVSSVYEVRTALTRQEREVRSRDTFGDLPPAERECRPAQEHCWTQDKQRVTVAYSMPLKDMEQMIVLGTNGVAAYALENTNATMLMQEYKEELVRVESASVERSLKHVVSHLRSVPEAEETQITFDAIKKVDPRLAGAVDAVIPQLQKQKDSLPARAKRNASLVTARPGGDPEIQFAEYAFAECPVAAAKKGTQSGGAKFRIWTVQCTLKNRQHPLKWNPVNWHVLALKDTIPAVAFNKTHMALMYQPYGMEKGNETLFVDIHPLSDGCGVPIKQHLHRFHLKFPSMASTGLLRISLSTLGIACASFGPAVIVFDALKVIPTPAIFTIPKHQRIITCAKVFHDPEGEDRYGNIVFGTNAGECFVHCWRMGTSHFFEKTPAVEPIYSAAFSNGRILMQTSMAVTGKLMPTISKDMVHLPIMRPLGMAVCGTLLFVLEKYGSIQIFSTLARNIVFPFKPPKHAPCGHDTMNQHWYDCVSADPEKVVVVYPNGLVKTMVLLKKPKA